MAISLLMKRCLVAVLVLVSFVLQGTTSVLAGTTGGINGTVVDASTSQPIAGAHVSAVSPSQQANTTTDASGRFSFISLSPDTYTVVVAASTKYDQASLSAVNVFADATQSISIAQPQKLKVIGTVTSRAASSLVKAGTTADVYSISAATQDKSSVVGGGGNLNSAWSALATVPGVYIAPNQSGYIGAGSTLSIRGGDYDQVGYELDGVPVNRAFDNYPSGPASSLGQQELQVYTGANPANSEAQGISGYINQVIRTGTYPATRNFTGGIGTPSLYNKVALEAGGANPSRTFSYYFGAGAYDQGFRLYDNSNGSSLNTLTGVPLVPCPGGGNVPAAQANSLPGCYSPSGVDYTNGGRTPAYVLAPFNIGGTSGIQDRDTVLNLHFGIPRKDGNKDDIQVLFDNNHINTAFYTSTNDQGGAALLANSGNGIPAWLDSYQYRGPVGVPFNAAYAGLVQPYSYPNSPVGRLPGSACGGASGLEVNSGCVPVNQQDTIANDQGILKVQYQRNFGTSAFLRVYGYTYYSDWLQADPQTAWANYFGPGSPDYELSSHTRGVSLNYSNQLNSQHLLSLQGSVTSATTTRDNNTAMYNGSSRPGSRSYFLALVDSTGGANGLCYTAAGTPTTCNLNVASDQSNPSAPVMFTYANVFNGGAPTTGTAIPHSGGLTVPATCGTSACQFLVVGNGDAATYNRVKPTFSSASITDQWKPTEKLNFNLGIRFDQFKFQGVDTTNGYASGGYGIARQFWYTAFNLDQCMASNGTLTDKTTLGLTPTSPCPAGMVSPNVQNTPSQINTYNELQPRVGMTYTVDPRTVLRASFGRYVEAPNSAFQQYDALQPNSPFLLYQTYSFQKFGFTTPGHSVRPPASLNYDFSYEHQFKGDLAVKVTPFLRKTQDQIQQFFLDQKTNFVSGLNVGRQTSQGVELAVDKGDFSRDGLAARLAFTYTNSYINYNRLASGQSVIDPINGQIQSYNAYTSFCATHATDSRCGATQTGAAAAPCYTAAGTADPACAAGSVANPYWNAPVQALFDPNGSYPTYDIFPAGIGTSYQAYGAPYVLTAVVNYKRGAFAVTPALQILSGQKYGAPLTTPGIIPDACAALAGVAPDASRYPYGAPGGSAYDASCAANSGTIGIPNPFTHQFDSLGAFRAPTNLLLHMQVSYQASKAVQIVGNFANIINRCFGGSSVPWARSNACNYTTYAAGLPPVGNVYNPGDTVSPYWTSPYFPSYPQSPFNAFVEVRIKL